MKDRKKAYFGFSFSTRCFIKTYLFENLCSSIFKLVLNLVCTTFIQTEVVIKIVAENTDLRIVPMQASRTDVKSTWKADFAIIYSTVGSKAEKMLHIGMK